MAQLRGKQVALNTGNFDKLLSSADDDVQKAMETIDEFAIFTRVASSESELETAVSELVALGGGTVLITGNITLTGDKSWDLSNIIIRGQPIGHYSGLPPRRINFAGYVVTLNGTGCYFQDCVLRGSLENTRTLAVESFGASSVITLESGEGDLTGQFTAGVPIVTSGATNGANNGTFTVASSTWDGTNTIITVSETTLVDEASSPAEAQIGSQTLFKASQGASGEGGRTYQFLRCQFRDCVSEISAGDAIDVSDLNNGTGYDKYVTFRFESCTLHTDGQSPAHPMYGLVVYAGTTGGTNDIKASYMFVYGGQEGAWGGRGSWGFRKDDANGNAWVWHDNTAQIVELTNTGQVATDGFRAVFELTAGATINSDHAGAVLLCTNSSSADLSTGLLDWHHNLHPGSVVYVVKAGAGDLNIVATSGATIRYGGETVTGGSSVTINTSYEFLQLQCIADDEWVLSRMRKVTEVPVEDLSTAGAEGTVPVAQSGGSLQMVHHYVVSPSDDLVSIVSAAGDNTELILAEGVHSVSSAIVVNGKTNFAIRGTPASRIDSSLSTGAVFDLDDLTDVELSGFEVHAVTDGDVFNLGGTNTRLKIHRVTAQNTNASGADFFDMSGTTTAQTGIFVTGCQVRGDIKSFVRLATAHASGVSVTNVVVRDNNVTTDVDLDDAIVVSNSSDGVVTQSQIHHNSTSGFTRGMYLEALTLSGVTFNDVITPGNKGILIDGASTKLRLTGNLVYDNGAGIGIHINAGVEHEIVNNRVESSASEGIRIESGQDRCKINVNTVVGAGSNGIDIQEGAGSCVCVGNMVYNANGDGLNCDADGVTLQGNFVEGSSGNGIEIGDTANLCANVLCQGNTSTGNTGAGIACRSTSSTIVGNLTYNNGTYGIVEEGDDPPTPDANHFADNKSFGNTSGQFSFAAYATNRTFGVENDCDSAIVANDLLSYETTASGRRVKRVGLSLDIADVGDGEVLVRDGTEIVGQVLSEGQVEANKTWEFLADMFSTPNTSDWGLNSPAAIIDDPTNASIAVAAFDDTTEEGVGMEFYLPTGATKFKVVVEARAASAPGSAQTVDFRLRHRGVPDDAALPSWSTVDMATMEIPTNAYFQYREYEFDVATVGMTAGRAYQLEWSRYTGGDDTLTGDLYVRSIRIFVRYDNVKWFPADTMQSALSADWSVNANAPIAVDSNNTALQVRLHDDTTEEGCGLVWHVPSGTAKMKLHLRSRAETTPSSHAVDSFTAGSTVTLETGEGDVTAEYPAGRLFTTSGATNGANNGTFEVQSSTWDGTNTIITTVETSLVTEASSPATSIPHKKVGVTLHYRKLGDGESVGSWVEHDLADVDIPASENWQYDDWEIDMASLGTPMEHGSTYQFQITRNTGDADDDLTGDWAVLAYGVEWY